MPSPEWSTIGEVMREGIRFLVGSPQVRIGGPLQPTANATATPALRAPAAAGGVAAAVRAWKSEVDEISKKGNVVEPILRTGWALPPYLR